VDVGQGPARVGRGRRAGQEAGLGPRFANRAGQAQGGLRRPVEEPGQSGGRRGSRPQGAARRTQAARSWWPRECTLAEAAGRRSDRDTHTGRDVRAERDRGLAVASRGRGAGEPAPGAEQRTGGRAALLRRSQGLGADVAHAGASQERTHVDAGARPRRGRDRHRLRRPADQGERGGEDPR